MRWNVSYNPEDNILCVCTEGETDVASANKMVEEVRDAIEQHGSALILIDHRQLLLNLSMVDIYDRPSILENLGLPKTSRIAEVVPESQLKAFQFLETVARNKGYRFSVFLDMSAAKAWLKS
jgi:hypothetical protein